jgi:hypothetical protein
MCREVDAMKGTQSVPHADTLDRLNSGPVTFSGDSDALYERHLTFDHVVPVAARDLLSPASATAGSAGWQLASSIPCGRSVFRAWALACATSTAS